MDDVEAVIASIAPALWDHAVDTFGDEARALEWFQTPLSALQDLTPEEFLSHSQIRHWERLNERLHTEVPPVQLIDDILTKIDYGVY